MSPRGARAKVAPAHDIGPARLEAVAHAAAVDVAREARPLAGVDRAGWLRDGARSC